MKSLARTRRPTFHSWSWDYIVLTKALKELPEHVFRIYAVVEACPTRFDCVCDVVEFAVEDEISKSP